VIAGRAFGTDEAGFSDQGFHFTSRGNPVDVGLVVARPLDMVRYPRLDVGFLSAQAGTLSVLVRESLDDPACFSDSTAIASQALSISIALDRLAWSCDDGTTKAPRRAAMLRLRFDLPSGSSATLVKVGLYPARPLSAEKLEQLELPILPAPDRPHEFDRALARIAQNRSAETWPVLQLPLDGRVEQILAARDQVYAAMPDAILIVNGSFNEVTGKARRWHPPPPDRPSLAPTFLLAGYALLLLALRLKPPLGLRLRSGLELVAVCAAPLWLIVGGRIGDNLEATQLAAIAITLAFALSLLAGGAPAQPTARTLKRGWWVALGSVLLTMALIVFLAAARLPENFPALEQVGRYLVWAALQQFLICVLVAERIERLTGSARVGLVGAALLFGLLHTPNAMLMQLTFVAGLIWVWNWQRHRALLANIAAHAACGLLLTLSLPAQWLHSAEVSARFFLGGL
jgi:membrane protease YdiL (CAAX protease family)